MIRGHTQVKRMGPSTQPTGTLAPLIHFSFCMADLGEYQPKRNQNYNYRYTNWANDEYIDVSRRIVFRSSNTINVRFESTIGWQVGTPTKTWICRHWIHHVEEYHYKAPGDCPSPNKDMKERFNIPAYKVVTPLKVNCHRRIGSETCRI